MRTASDKVLNKVQYESIVAPHKEMLVVESDVHLLFNEDLDVVLPPILDMLSFHSPCFIRDSECDCVR